MNASAFELFEQWLPVLADLDTTLLLHGEDGVGADELAAAVHTLGRRRHGPLVTVDCATLTAERFSPVMLGAWSRRLPSLHPHARGALAEAQGGTLLLSGVDTLCLAVQPRLRRVLEDRAFTPAGAEHPVGLDVRVIATAASDLTHEMERGAFRADLFHRLAVFPVRIPPLRERADDLPRLAQYVMEEIARETGRPMPTLSRSALTALCRYPWPGNVRELTAVLVRAVLSANGPRIDRIDDLSGGSPPAHANGGGYT